MSRLMVVLVLSFAAGLIGCSADTVAVQDQEQRVIKDATPDQVLSAAASILQREFGRATVDRGARQIVTGPVEFTTERESGTARDLYRGKSTMRRKAVFNVSRVSSDTIARLRIDIERRDTERQTVMQPHRQRLSDTPGEDTPIETDAATTHEQNMVWTRVRRDRSLERALLDELREQFARVAAPVEGPATQPDRPAPAVTSAPAADPHP